MTPAEVQPDAERILKALQDVRTPFLCPVLDFWARDGHVHVLLGGAGETSLEDCAPALAGGAGADAEPDAELAAPLAEALEVRRSYHCTALYKIWYCAGHNLFDT